MYAIVPCVYVPGYTCHVCTRMYPGSCQWYGPYQMLSYQLVWYGHITILVPWYGTRVPVVPMVVDTIPVHMYHLVPLVPLWYHGTRVRTRVRTRTMVRTRVRTIQPGTPVLCNTFSQKYPMPEYYWP